MLRSLLRSTAFAALLYGAAASLATAGDGPIYKGGHIVNDNVGYNDYAGPGGCRTCNTGNCQYRFYGQPDLFYNYYVPANCGGVGAELYLSPKPVPPIAGHTYITYQPLMPHEFTYVHDRTYHRYYNGGAGLTRTHVHYYRAPGTALKWW